MENGAEGSHKRDTVGLRNLYSKKSNICKIIFHKMLNSELLYTME